jgi:hypothetical protein
MGRGLIDLGIFILRLALWIEYGAVASVFLVKNLYNILHTISLVERSRGVKNYRKDTLFMQYVRPKDWYGMTQEVSKYSTYFQVTSLTGGDVSCQSINLGMERGHEGKLAGTSSVRTSCVVILLAVVETLVGVLLSCSTICYAVGQS